jgi:putative membrane protein
MEVTSEQPPPSSDPRPNPQTRLAIERTLLAWIRTGLAMMGFGFVLDRFGFFLRELSRVSHMGVRSVHVSLWSGILLIALGAAVNLSAAVLS